MAARDAMLTGYVEGSDSDPYPSSSSDGDELSEFEEETYGHGSGEEEDEDDSEDRKGRWTIIDPGELNGGSKKRKRGEKAQRIAPARKRGGGAPNVKVEVKPDPEMEKENTPKTKTKSTPKPKTPRAKKPPTTVPSSPPANWEEIYSLVQAMRATKLAPVDTMGCETLADPTVTPRDQRFQTLTALMLSSQTKDTVTSVAIKNLQDNLPGGFSLESILAVEPDVLNDLIGKVGFHNLKTKYIKNTAEILKEKWGGDVPDSIPGLVSLPGVGPKMAYLCLSAAWGRTEGIGVDVHVHRITNLWGWHKTNTPEETRACLEAWLPQEKWHDINTLLVGFGQTVCLPVGRKCGECTLAERGLCKSAVVGKKVVKRVKKEVVVKGEDGEGGVVVKEEAVVEEREIKAEDVEVKAEEVEDLQVADIEDLGRAIGGRSTRTRRR